MHNADNSVRIILASFMDCTPAMQGIQGSYIFNNYTDANGVTLNGTLTYYTIGASATVIVIEGTITATGSATGAFVYKVNQLYSIQAGFKLADKLNVSYSYDAYSTPISEFDGGELCCVLVDHVELLLRLLRRRPTGKPHTLLLSQYYLKNNQNI